MKAIRAEVHRWGALWYSRSKLSGETQYFMWDGMRPALFRTRREAREWIAQEYGYIAKRPDLRQEPHGWHVPSAVRVVVTLTGYLPAKPKRTRKGAKG